MRSPAWASAWVSLDAFCWPTLRHDTLGKQRLFKWLQANLLSFFTFFFVFPSRKISWPTIWEEEKWGQRSSGDEVRRGVQTKWCTAFNEHERHLCLPFSLHPGDHRDHARTDPPPVASHSGAPGVSSRRSESQSRFGVLERSGTFFGTGRDCLNSFLPQARLSVTEHSGFCYYVIWAMKILWSVGKHGKKC